MFYIGCHLSSAKGFLAMGKDAEKIGATTFQFFTRNPRGGSAKPLDHEDIQAFLKLKEELGIGTLVAHAPYTLNGCSADEKIRDFAKRTMADDLERMEAIPGNLYNFHPGSHLGKIEVDTCLSRIAESINITLAQTSGVCAVIENTAGQGSNLGYTFEQIAYIINEVEDKSRVGVCLDTAHTLAAGYDIKTPEGFSETFRHFDEVVGFSYLRGMHLNDSKKELGSRVDRHESIGKGLMGLDTFRMIMADPRFDNMPLILETPDEALWPEEIQLLYKQLKS